MASSPRSNIRAKRFFTASTARFCAARYHSLVVRGDTLPDDLTVTAKTDGLVMGLSHKSFPRMACSFTPKASRPNMACVFLQNFLDLAAQWNHNERRAPVSGPAFSRG